MKKLTYAVMMLLTLGVIAACSESDDDEKTTATPASIEGTWVSAGSNVAPLLEAYFASSGGVDTIIAVFNPDLTYTVKQVNGNGTKANYGGTYVITKSTGSNIHKIVLNETVIAKYVSEGIFEIYDAAVDSMKYEVVALGGANVPATPTTGFGSTNGGAFGTTNIQKYVRVK
ncbi:MAG: hypothetical protein L6Q77_12055 [Bacteroidetes bacterium]|nr:hypothetical protein [Bacteroidota bacterium]